jgi:hypothetical protein
MIKSVCNCNNCTEIASGTIIDSGTNIGPPQKPKDVPSQFKWKPMVAANKYWTYLVTCKICKWEKFSDFPNAQEHMWFHYADDCKRPYKKWNN